MVNSYVVNAPVSLDSREQLNDIVTHGRSEGNVDGRGTWYERANVMNDH